MEWTNEIKIKIIKKIIEEVPETTDPQRHYESIYHKIYHLLHYDDTSLDRNKCWFEKYL